MSDNETRQKLIDSAKKEFFENGFAKASLRKICTNAGVTTGALYFFFKNKDDLFSAIVAPPLLKLKEMLIKHNREDEEYLGSPDEQTRSVENQLSTHKEAVTMVSVIFMIIMTHSCCFLQRHRARFLKTALMSLWRLWKRDSVQVQRHCSKICPAITLTNICSTGLPTWI